MLRTKRQETYTVPELTVKDIKDYFAEQDIQINTNDLLRPSLESTVKLLDTLLEFFTNQSFSDILEDLKDNPLATEHEDTFFLVNVHRRMNELLNMIGVYNFSIKLILKPEPKKLIAIPSILVSFSMFRDMRISIFKDGMNLLQGKNEEIKEINQQINEISYHFNKFSEERDKLAYEVIVLEKEIENILQSGNELEKYIEGSLKKDSKFEKEKEFLEDSISNLKLELQNKKQESLNYQNYLISDPEELKRNFEKMVKELESEEIKNQELNKESNLLNKNYEKITQISYNLEVINNLKNEHDSLQMKSNELSGKLNNFLSEIKEKEAIIKSLKLKSDHENKKKESLQEKLRKHKENEYNFSKNLYICTDEVKNEYERTLEKYNLYKDTKSELEKKKSDLEYKIMDSTSKFELETDEIINLIYKLKEIIFQNIREASSLIDE